MKKYNIGCTADVQEKLQNLLDEGLCNAEICFAPGTYYLTGSIRLTEENRNIRFTGEGEVRLCGSMPLTAWHPVQGTEDAARFDPSVRDRVMYCDVEPGHMKAFASRGALKRSHPGFSELLDADGPLTLAQYPRNIAYTKITGVGPTAEDEWGEKDGVLEKGFYWEDDRLKTWRRDNDIWALGFWKYDWANSFEQVDAFDPESGHVQMKPPYGWYGYRIGQRIRFYNVMEEVRAPGDYAIDFARNRVYLYPKVLPVEVTVSVNAEPLFWLEGASRVSFTGLYLGDTCATAIEAVHTEDLTIDCCRFAYVGSCAVCIVDGHGPMVKNSTFHGCGDGGVVMAGGDRCTLEPMNGRIFNNHFYDIARWGKCYFPAIVMAGVGMEARHNLIHDCPHTAIMYWGNEIKILDNEIYRVVLETGDAGAVYAGRNLTFRGNEVSHNYIHHLGSGVGIGTMGIYNDDTLCGTVMCDNFFEEVTRAIQLGGGRDFVVKNNVFVKCAPGVHFDSRSADRGSFWEDCPRNALMEGFYRIRRHVTPYGVTERCMKKRWDDGAMVSAMNSVHVQRYPELAQLDTLYQSQIGFSKYFPGQARIESNVFMSRMKFRYRIDGKRRKIYDRNREMEMTPMMMEYIHSTRWDLKRGIAGTVGDVRLISNMQGTKEDFADVDWSNLQVIKSPEVYQHQHMPSDFASIGLLEDQRAENPVKVKMRVDFAPGDDTARIGLRNLGQTPAAGMLYFFASADLKVEADSLPFAVDGGAEVWVEVPVSGSSPEGIVEVHSDVPGVRPARSV